MTGPIWQATACALRTDEDCEPVAGWRYGELFLDFRPMIEADGVPFCWFISHVRSGLGIIGLLTDLRQARMIAEAMHGLADWSTATPGKAAPAGFRAWLDRQRCAWCMSSDTIGPFATVEHPPRLTPPRLTVVK